MDEIIKKWSKNGQAQTMVEFKDGDISNCAITNLGYVSVQDVFASSPEERRADWDCFLTPKERKFVLDHWGDFRAHFTRT